MFYVDSSVQFNNKVEQSLLKTIKNIGILTQYIEFQLICYTNPKTFDWFGGTLKEFERFYTIDANTILFHRNFLTSLILKAWVTCALDTSCIAPIGSQLYKCCGCHRYDQDALTIINTFFYAHRSIRFKPPLAPYVFPSRYGNFFSVLRGHQKDYFV